MTVLIIITLIYLLFAGCIIYPPTEFATAGFTIPQVFDGLLGSENTNFVTYHMRRTSITMLVHSFLPMGYWFALYIGGWRSEWLLFTFITCWMFIMLCFYKLLRWWEYRRHGHPMVKTLLPYVTEGSDWRVVAADFNTDFKHMDKVIIQLRTTSKFIATPRWLIKVSQYSVDVIKQVECTLVATTSDHYSLSAVGEDGAQYINIEAVPSREDVKPFSFRIASTDLRDLQPRLFHPVRLPDNLTLLPSIIEKFLTVFRSYAFQNPKYIIPENEEIEACIGCMQEQANVKLDRLCQAPPAHLVGGPPECRTCHCRVLWCMTCIARWWAARAGSMPPSQWLSARCTCPVCRAPFCVLDVRPARKASTLCPAPVST